MQYLKSNPKRGKYHSKLNGYRIFTMQNTKGTAPSTAHTVEEITERLTDWPTCDFSLNTDKEGRTEHEI